MKRLLIFLVGCVGCADGECAIPDPPQLHHASYDSVTDTVSLSDDDFSALMEWQSTVLLCKRSQ